MSAGDPPPGYVFSDVFGWVPHDRLEMERIHLMTDLTALGTRGAIKLDTGKLPAMSGAIEYFPLALLAVAGVSQFGYEKYGEWQGWRGVADGPRRYADALGRHILYKDQPDTSKDTARMQEILTALGVAHPSTRLVHMAQLAWNALASLEKQIEKERDGS